MGAGLTGGRNLYLSNVPVDEALAKYLKALEGKLRCSGEILNTTEAVDRVTSRAVYARYCSPLFNAAAMDGIAVVAAATAGAAEASPKILYRGRDFIPADTGDPIRPPFDAVIMAEDIQDSGDNAVIVRAAASGWQHIRPIGEDIVAGEMILPSRRIIRPIDIGVLLSAGVTEIEVLKKPAVAIFPTGNEMIEPGAVPREGDIIESNTRMLEALAREAGGEGCRFAVVPDDPALLEEAVSWALKNFDMVLVNAGSSAGTEDYTVSVMRKLGDVIVHGVAMKPGKPVILAVAEGKPLIGIPGYPVSAYLAWRIFAAPILAMMAGRTVQPPMTVKAVSAKRIVSSLKHREYVRVKVGNVDGKLVASPLERGAGAAMSLVRADGFCIIEQNSEGIEAGEPANIELIRPPGELERTLVCTGSHDLVIDIIADIMSGGGEGGVFLAATHVGSLAGLMALKRGECHIAPIHLLDENSGRYNTPWLERLFPGEPIELIKGVGRVQGLIVKKGNPLNLRSVADLSRCNYINRQRGSGTRLFLDYRLKEAGLSPEHIRGYDREAITHMAVAAAVQSGGADAGMGIASAAAALDLDFIPLGNEEYDFAFYSRFTQLPQMQTFLAILRGGIFRERLATLKGYTWEHCGEPAAAPRYS